MPRESVQVKGQVERYGPVEIRWNGVGGELLATAFPGKDGLFSVPVQVPDVAPGIYSITVATQNAGVGRTALEVTAAAGGALPSSTEQLWPSVSSQLFEAEPSSTGVSPVGVGLLGAGLVGLFGASAVAVARTRRVLAGPRQ